MVPSCDCSDVVFRFATVPLAKIIVFVLLSYLLASHMLGWAENEGGSDMSEEAASRRRYAPCTVLLPPILSSVLRPCP